MTWKMEKVKWRSLISGVILKFILLCYYICLRTSQSVNAIAFSLVVSNINNFSIHSVVEEYNVNVVCDNEHVLANKRHQI